MARSFDRATFAFGHRPVLWPVCRPRQRRLRLRCGRFAAHDSGVCAALRLQTVPLRFTAGVPAAWRPGGRVGRRGQRPAPNRSSVVAGLPTVPPSVCCGRSPDRATLLCCGRSQTVPLRLCCGRSAVLCCGRFAAHDSGVCAALRLQTVPLRFTAGVPAAWRPGGRVGRRGQRPAPNRGSRVGETPRVVLPWQTGAEQPGRTAGRARWLDRKCDGPYPRRHGTVSNPSP